MVKLPVHVYGTYHCWHNSSASSEIFQGHPSDQYYHHTSGEWPILYILLGIHAVFLLLLTGMSAGVLRRLKANDGEEMAVKKDEMVFTAAQYVGLICGIIGLVWTVFALVLLPWW